MGTLLRESATLEFKREISKSFCTTVVAFANSDGGRILVGVSDGGTPLGVENPDVVMLQASHAIADSICPEILPFVSINTLEIEGKPVVEVIVEEGDRKPYCLANKGFSPAGVYLRKGSGNTPASVDAIRSMIRTNDGDVFENRRSENQQITFNAAQVFFSDANVSCTRENLKTLHAIGLDGYCTNLGLLLSDECPFSIKCAVYDDEDGLDYHDRREFTGSVFSQMQDALSFLELNNTLHASFEGLRRNDSHAVPPRAMREALLNAVMHKDYDYNAPIIINVFANRIEFISTGGLAQGLTEGDIMAGVSATRNPRLAAVLLRLNMAEGYGMGIRIMKKLYKRTGLAPQFKINPGSFVTVLPKIGTEPPSVNTSIAEASQSSDHGLNPHWSDCPPLADTTNEQAITTFSNMPAFHPAPDRRRYEYAVIEFAEEHGEVRRADVERMLGISRDAALALVEGLVMQGALMKRGKSRNTHYVPVEASH